MERFWVICEDSRQCEITDETPIDSYLFFYETSPLYISRELHDILETSFAIQRDNDLNDIALNCANVKRAKVIPSTEINTSKKICFKDK